MGDYTWPTVEMIEVAPDWRIRIEQEQDDSGHANPRTDDGNLGLLVMPHSRYSLGDASDPHAWTDEHDRVKAAMAHFRMREDFVRWAKIFLGSRVVLPVALMDHSGLSCWVGSGPSAFDPGGWDSGQIGWILDTPATRAADGCADDITAESVEAALRWEVRAYDAYLQGNVFGWVTERRETWTKDSDPDEHRDDWEVQDSCWGYLVVDGSAPEVEGAGMPYVIESALDSLPDDVRAVYDAAQASE